MLVSCQQEPTNVTLPIFQKMKSGTLVTYNLEVLSAATYIFNHLKEIHQMRCPSNK